MDIHTRRTIRKYTSQPVEDELLNRLLADASRTQTMGNLQLYSVVVTRDEAMKAELAHAHYDQPMATQAPVVLTICADFRRTTDWCNEREATPGFDNLLSFHNASTDALLYCQTFCHLAEEAGLGICFLGTTIYNPHLIIDLLELPQLVMPVATLTVGWPAEQPPLTDRLPLQAFVHHEVYTPYTLERINTLYAHKEGLKESQHFVKENGKSTLAQVVAECRYTKEANEAMSQTLLHTLQAQGFFRLEDFVQTPKILESRPEVLECDVIRIQVNKEKWVAFIGLYEGLPYEIFTGLMDDEEGIMLPKSVNSGYIVKRIGENGQKRYDFQFKTKRGYKTTVEGLSSKFNPEYWSYAKLISGVLRYRMPIYHVVKLINSLDFENEKIAAWTTGVARALKRYLPGAQIEEE